MTCDRKTVLCTIVHRAVKTIQIILTFSHRSQEKVTVQYGDVSTTDHWHYIGVIAGLLIMPPYPTPGTLPYVPLILILPFKILDLPSRSQIQTHKGVPSIGLVLKRCDRFLFINSKYEYECSYIHTYLLTYLATCIYHSCSVRLLAEREALQMQRDRATHHKYEISHLKKLAIAE